MGVNTEQMCLRKGLPGREASESRVLVFDFSTLTAVDKMYQWR